MRLYECTLYEEVWGYSKKRPAVWDDKEVSREIVAESAGKARYKFWCHLAEFYEVKLQDIRVKSLAKRKAILPMTDGWQYRMETANAIFRIVGSYGRHFFSENSDRRGVLVVDPFFAHFKADSQGELWYIDRYTRKAVLVRLDDRWPGFSDGGTLRAIVQHLEQHINEGVEINPNYFGREYWGYGEDGPKVFSAVKELLSIRGTESTGKHQPVEDAEHVRATEQREPEAGSQGR